MTYPGRKTRRYVLRAFTIAIATMLLSTLLAEAQDLREKTNALIGRIDSDGVIRNRSNARIGKIDSDGAIRDRSHARIWKD